MTRLTGVDAIRQYLGRSWGTIHGWIETKEFPARKLDSYWESDTELIDEWRREQIRKGEDDGTT